MSKFRAPPKPAAWIPPNTVSGLCKGWQTKARAEHPTYSGPPIRQPVSDEPDHVREARYEATIREVYAEVRRQAAAGQLGPGPIAVSCTVYKPTD